MPDRQEILRSLHGVWRLALFDRRGLQFLNLTVEGFWHSFGVSVFILPIFLLLALSGPGAAPEVTAGVALTLLATFAASWLLFPLAMVFITRLLQISDRFIPYITAHNWSRVIINLALLPIHLLTHVEAPAAAQAAALLIQFAFILILIYQWFIALTALRVGGMTASAVIILQYALDFLIIWGGQ